MAQQEQGLDTVLEHNGADLCGGVKQRMLLARGLFAVSHVLLCDEGTAALDPKCGLAIEKLLVSCSKTTLMLVTHNLCPEIKDVLDQIVTV